MPRPKKDENIKTDSVKSSKGKQITLLKGFKDILPAEQDYWEFVKNAFAKTADKYGFAWIDTPILEPIGLFVKAVGKQTDIVEKELYSFVDKGKELVALRPEGTSSVCRAYIEHGMFNMPQPLKLFYFGQMFRHDKPQAGRQRQFFQFGMEVLGEKNPAVDAQLIVCGQDFYKRVGLPVKVQINSIGCKDCRPEYVKNLVGYYKSKKSKICEDCKKRMTKNPMRLLDCKEDSCKDLKEDAPQIVDYLCENCKNHFMKVLEYLDEANVEYDLNPKLVRGLDYYTNTVFEFFDKEDAVFKSALGGGGRYDDLIEMLGSRPTPACGFALGIERIISKIKAKEISLGQKETPDVFLAQIGEQAKRKAFVLFETLYDNGIKVVENFSKDSLKAQLELANKKNVKLVLILGQREVVDGTILVRDMVNGVQETVNYNKVLDEVKKRVAEIKKEKQ